MADDRDDGDDSRFDALGDKPRRELTDEERAALDARDRGLLERFILHEPVSDQLFDLLARYGWSYVKAYQRQLLPRWEDLREEMWLLLVTWRAKKNLRVFEPLPYLAQRLLRQLADTAETQRQHDLKNRSIDAHEVGSRRRDAFETRMTTAVDGPERERSPEAEVALREVSAWLREGATHLHPTEQETFDAVVKWSYGLVDTVAKALGVTEANGWKRASRLREAFLFYAQSTGATEMVEKLMARRYGKPPPPPMPEVKGPSHRVEDAIAWRAGRLGAEAKAEYEAHKASCLLCRRTLRELAALEDAMDAFILAPPPPFAAGPLALQIERRFRRSRVHRWIGVAAAALVAAVAWALYPSPKSAPPAQPPAPPVRPVPVPRPHPKLYMAPRRPPADAGK